MPILHISTSMGAGLSRRHHIFRAGQFHPGHIHGPWRYTKRSVVVGDTVRAQRLRMDG